VSDPRDWVTTGVTPVVDPADARRAAVFVAAASIRQGWDKETLHDLLMALGLAEGREVVAASGSLFGCPSPSARTRHVRQGNDCRKCWPGGRGIVANTGETTPERAMIGGDAGASSHPAQASDPNLRLHERTG
jgi:hypothetical protein